MRTRGDGAAAPAKAARAVMRVLTVGHPSVRLAALHPGKPNALSGADAVSFASAMPARAHRQVTGTAQVARHAAMARAVVAAAGGLTTTMTAVAARAALPATATTI